VRTIPAMALLLPCLRKTALNSVRTDFITAGNGSAQYVGCVSPALLMAALSLLRSITLWTRSSLVGLPAIRPEPTPSLYVGRCCAHCTTDKAFEVFSSRLASLPPDISLENMFKSRFLCILGRSSGFAPPFFFLANSLRRSANGRACSLQRRLIRAGTNVVCLPKGVLPPLS